MSEIQNQSNVDSYNKKAKPIRDAINSQPLTAFYQLTKSKYGLYNCPICGSGTKKNGTGALQIDENNRVFCRSRHCFASPDGKEEGTDTLDALKRILHMTEREVFAYCHMPINAPLATPPAPKKPKPEPQPPRSFLEQIDKYAAALTPDSEGYTYLIGRNITPETMHRFKLGYDAKNHCITIPYNPQGTYYISRRILPEAQWPAGKGKYDKPSNKVAGYEPLFNASALYNSDIVFVVEGPFDAISIAQAGGAAIALGSTGASRLLHKLEEKPTKAAIAVCLDNDPHEQQGDGRYKDEVRREDAAKLGTQLEKLGLQVFNCTAALMGEETDPTAATFRKDANEVLQKDGPEALKTAIEEITADIKAHMAAKLQEEEADRQTHTGAGMVDAFLEAVQTRRYEPVPTGIAGIDAAIGGGFMRQQLVQLGAAPGAGKTALAQWIFENMAMRGNDCVFLNLEMSREQILARSLSRVAARKGHKINAAAVLQGYKWTEEQRKTVLYAAAEYKARIAEHMIYNPDGITSNLDTIMKYLEVEAQRAEKEEKPAPFVVLDYLQIVSGEPREDTVALIKRTLTALKDYAVRHNTTVFTIMAYNRESNNAGRADMGSARDTSAIEYSADLQLGLTFTKCLGDNGKKVSELTKDEKQHKTLVITKSRFGGEGTKVKLKFDGETMTFTEEPDDDQPKVTTRNC